MKCKNVGRTQLFLVMLSLVGLLFIGLSAGQVLADGTETLGDPSIPIASGTGIVAAGVGLQDAQPETIMIDVPGQVAQVLLYWAGAATDSNLADDTISVNGNQITGTLIGGPAFFFSSSGKTFNYSNFRADITDFGLVASGMNSLTVQGLDNLDGDGNGENSGAGVLVIFDDGSGVTDIGIKDGLDLAFAGFPAPRMATIPQTFSFTPSGSDRTADLVIFAGSVGQTGNRTNIIRVTADGAITDLPNLLASVDGDLWDTLTIPVEIPADASELTVEIISGDGTGNPASLNWIGAGLSIGIPCVDIEKLVSVDDGQTFVDADDCADAPVTDSDAEYKLVVENCGTIALTDVIVTDSDLDISVNIGSLAPGEVQMFTKDDSSFENLDTPGICPDGPEIENLAMVATNEGPTDADPACVKCEEREFITRTLGYWKGHPTVIDGSFDGPDGFPSLLPLSFCGEDITESCDAVAFLSLGGGGIDNFKRQGMAALLNCQGFGCPGDILELIHEGSDACAAGGDFDFGAGGDLLDIFNNSGDNLDLPFQSPSADPKFCENGDNNKKK